MRSILSVASVRFDAMTNCANVLVNKPPPPPKGQHSSGGNEFEILIPDVDNKGPPFLWSTPKIMFNLCNGFMTNSVVKFYYRLYKSLEFGLIFSNKSNPLFGSSNYVKSIIILYIQNILHFSF